jgi:hypothetical protein
VHHAARVGVRERVGHLGEHARRLGGRGARRAGEAGAERLAVDERHREPGHAAVVAGREHRRDVRVRELRGRLRLAEEARAHAVAEGELRGEHLERDRALQPHLDRAVHHGHAAAADLLAHVVAVAHGGHHAVEQRVRGGAGRRGRRGGGHGADEGEGGAHPRAYAARGARVSPLTGRPAACPVVSAPRPAPPAARPAAAGALPRRRRPRHLARGPDDPVDLAGEHHGPLGERGHLRRARRAGAQPHEVDAHRLEGHAAVLERGGRGVAAAREVGHRAALPLEVGEALHAAVAGGAVERVGLGLEADDLGLEDAGGAGGGVAVELGHGAGERLDAGGEGARRAGHVAQALALALGHGADEAEDLVAVGGGLTPRVRRVAAGGRWRAGRRAVPGIAVRGTGGERAAQRARVRGPRAERGGGGGRVGRLPRGAAQTAPALPLAHLGALGRIEHRLQVVGPLGHHVGEQPLARLPHRVVPVEAVAPELRVAVGHVDRPEREGAEEVLVAHQRHEQQHRADDRVPAELAAEVAHRPRLPPRQLVGGGGEQVDVAGVGRVGRRPGDAARPAVQLLGQPAPVAAPGDGDAERAEPPAAFGRGGGRRGRRRERRAAGPGRQRGGARPRPRRLRGVVRARGDRALAEEHGLELVGAGEARGRVLLEHAHHRRRQVGRAVGAPLVDGDRPLGEVLDEHGRRARRLERQLAGEHLVAPRRPASRGRAAVDLAVAGALLGAHVRRRADGHPVAVRRASLPSITARAMPKSVTMARSPSWSSRMLSGLMSRCTTPRAWA